MTVQTLFVLFCIFFVATIILVTLLQKKNDEIAKLNTDWEQRFEKMSEVYSKSLNESLDDSGSGYIVFRLDNADTTVGPSAGGSGGPASKNRRMFFRLK